jgi:predicted Zn-dependent protease
VLLARADVEEARRAFEAELALDPTHAPAAYELAEIERRAGRFDRAAELFARAIAHQPDLDAARVGLARTLIRLGRPDEALPHLTVALARNPDDDVAHYQVAEACRSSGDTAGQQAALTAFSRVRKDAEARPWSAARAHLDVTPQLLEIGNPPP